MDRDTMPTCRDGLRSAGEPKLANILHLRVAQVRLELSPDHRWANTKEVIIASNNINT